MTRNYKSTFIIQHAINIRRKVLMCLLNEPTNLKLQTIRPTNIPRTIYCFLTNIQGLNNQAFSRMYRIPKPMFFKLAYKMHQKTCLQTKNGFKTSITLRLSVTLRWLAGGSYLDICHNHHIAVSSFYYFVKQKLIQLDQFLKIEFKYRDGISLESASREFSRNCRSPLFGCCAALDGIAVKIMEPRKGDVGNSSTYYNRKGVFAINVQAACDSLYRFVFVSGLAAGSTHDSTAFAMSMLSTLLQNPNEGLLEGYWIACDDAYSASNNMVTPWPGRNLSIDKDCFNYWLSSARIHIEQAFGMLVSRWGILWRPLRVKVELSAKIVIILCKLHNFIIDNNLPTNIPSPLQSDNAGHATEPDYSISLQDECSIEEPINNTIGSPDVCSIRQTFTQKIKDGGLKRPSIY